VPSRIHSAHIGQEVEVHYRWHPFYGRRLRLQHSEQRASGRVIHVEVAPGTVTVLPDWMVDASVCAGMTLGAPRVSVDALRELRRLLLERGFRRSFCDDSPVVQENRNEQAEKEGAVAGTGRTAPDEYRVRVEPPSRSARSRADEGVDGPGLSADAGGRGRGRGGRR